MTHGFLLIMYINSMEDAFFFLNFVLGKISAISGHVPKRECTGGGLQMHHGSFHQVSVTLSLKASVPSAFLKPIGKNQCLPSGAQVCVCISCLRISGRETSWGAATLKAVLRDEEDRSVAIISVHSNVLLEGAGCWWANLGSNILKDKVIYIKALELERCAPSLGRFVIHFQFSFFHVIKSIFQNCILLVVHEIMVGGSWRRGFSFSFVKLYIFILV